MHITFTKRVTLIYRPSKPSRIALNEPSVKCVYSTGTKRHSHTFLTAVTKSTICPKIIFVSA